MQKCLDLHKKSNFPLWTFSDWIKHYAGTQNPNNWKLRLNKDYQKDFYEKLAWQPGDKGVNNVAVNMPELLERAVKSKIIMDGGKFEDQQQLLDDLEYCDKSILKVKE